MIHEDTISAIVKNITSDKNYISTKDHLPCFNLGSLTIKTSISQKALIDQLTLYNIVSQRLMASYSQKKNYDFVVSSPYLNATTLRPQTMILLYTIKSQSDTNGTTIIGYASLSVKVVSDDSHHTLDEFIDLPFDSQTYSWCSSIIYELRDKHIITGYPDRTFRPDNPVTRAEFCAMIARALELKGSTKNNFTDLSQSNWAANSIGQATNAGLVKGISNTTFDPLGNITNEQSLTIAVRALDNVNGSLNLSVDQVFVLLFKLAHPEKVSTWARPTVAEAIHYDLIYDYNKFDSTLPITRAEVAVLFYRMFIQLDEKP